MKITQRAHFNTRSSVVNTRIANESTQVQSTTKRKITIDNKFKAVQNRKFSI